jgi:hypothetical protein
MMKQKMISKRYALCTAILFIWILWALVSGCSALKSNGNAAESSPPPADSSAESTPTYYDFGDVLIPKEMKVEKNDSFIYRTPGMTVGRLSLKGSVESGSLANFFKNKMPVDGWRLISSIEGQRIMMLFQKTNRWCVINISGGQFSTTAEVWVSTSISGMVGDGGGNKLKK